MARQAGLWLVRALVTALLMTLLWGLGRIPVGTPADHSLLRLSWRMSGAQVRICRERSEEELLKLPPHMRLRQSCVDHVVPYRLALAVDGAARLDRSLLPRGAKGDRPIYVQEDLPLSPGAHRVQVEFAPVIPGAEGRAGDDRDEDEGEDEESDSELEERLRKEIARTARFRFEGNLQTEAGRITLLELEQGTGTWKVYGP